VMAFLYLFTILPLLFLVKRETELSVYIGDDMEYCMGEVEEGPKILDMITFGKIKIFIALFLTAGVLYFSWLPILVYNLVGYYNFPVKFIWLYPSLFSVCAEVGNSMTALIPRALSLKSKLAFLSFCLLVGEFLLF